MADKSMFMDVIDKVRPYLQGLPYPIDKSSLLAQLKDKGVPEWAMTLLNKIPDKTYKTAGQVMTQVQKISKDPSNLSLDDVKGLI